MTNEGTGVAALSAEGALDLSGSVVATGGSDEERVLSDGEQVLQSVSIQDRRREPPSSFVRTNQILQWQCPHCPFVGECPAGVGRFCKRTARKMHGIRDRHLRCYHEGQPRFRGFLALQFTPVLPAGVDAHWQCPACSGGFIDDMWERMSKSAQQNAKTRHRATHHAAMTRQQWLRASRRLTGSGEGYRDLQRRLAVGKSVAQRARRCAAMAQQHDIQGYLHPRLVLGKGRVCVATGLRCLRCFRTFHKKQKETALSRSCL